MKNRRVRVSSRTEMRASECPHCYSTVIFTASGLCPACHENPESGTADRTKTKITIWEKQKLPELCFGCGNATDSTVVVSKASASPTARNLKMFVAVVLFPVRLVFFGMRNVLNDSPSGRRPFQRVKVKIPVCLKCQGHAMPRDVWTDFEEGTISFVVPKSVAEAMRNPAGQV